MIDLLALQGTRILCLGLRSLPLPWARSLVGLVVRGATKTIFQRYRRIADTNFRIAFPTATESERRQLLRQAHDSLAGIIVDAARMPTITRAWCETHIKADFVPGLLALRQANPGKGMLLVSGHLGSFELLGNVIGMLGFPISVVARSFALPRLNRWWNRGREQSGNRVIGRAGAFPEVMADLKKGRGVGVLFDQNVKRAHALFLPWFGRAAATTKMVALAAIRTEVPIYVIGIRALEGDRYEVWGSECDCHDVYRSDKKADEKVVEITARLVKTYESFIQRAPGEWFWFHRRWKTRPEGEAEDLYG